MDAKGNIEVWLQGLVDGMQDTVKQVRMRARAGLLLAAALQQCACRAQCTLPQPQTHLLGLQTAMPQRARPHMAVAGR